MREVYCYYKVRVEDAPALPDAFEALQIELAARLPQLHLSLLRRADAPRAAGAPGEAPLDTWMEIYRQPGVGLDEATEARVEAAARRHMGRWIVGERHIERFCLAR